VPFQRCKFYSILLFFISLMNADGPQATLSNRRRRCRVLKGGEEVRTDQRVEQLFDVVNGLLRRSHAAAAASLQVGTRTFCQDQHVTQ
jgi:hypothetical protein